MSRLSEVLEVVSRSVNCNRTRRRLFEQIADLEEQLAYMDVNDFEDLYNNGEEMVELVKNTLDMDISDVLEDDEDIESSTKVCGSDNLKLDHWAVGAKVGDQIYDKFKDRIGEVVKTGQSGNYNLIYVDFNDGSKILKINPMDDAQRKGRFFLVLD